jgi:hypothetical protein
MPFGAKGVSWETSVDGASCDWGNIVAPSCPNVIVDAKQAANTVSRFIRHLTKM